jgi:amino acid permease
MVNTPKGVTTWLMRPAALPYKSPLQPYVSWVTLFAVSLVIVFSGMLLGS